ncbi:MAG: hypothetical protein CMG74_07155 [Candidatus Marinimicrobia bacterium]|nr:hypothetical protein [Candidatus Neomarinimicrobiota bacterium]|tara:strand:+ start:594 stop:1010 length:417 start_codon:yes stop_codon:yes gene_type:complete
MIIKLIFLIVFSLGFVLGKNTDTTIYKKPKTAFFFSLAPGFGQLYNGKWLKAVIFIGLEGAAAKGWFDNSNYYNNFESGNYQLSRQRYLEKRNKYAWWMGFIYMFGMLDAVVDAHLDPFDEVMNTNIENDEEEESLNE